MDNESFVKFLPAQATRSQLLRAIRRYIGVEYSMRNVYVRERPDGSLYGKTDCLRLLLMACRDVGYLPPEFNMNMKRPREANGRPPSPSDTVWQMLETNCEQIAKEAAVPGDVLLMQFDDVDPRLNEIHHVAMKTSNDPFPYGMMIHALNSEADGSGRVQEVTINQLSFGRIKSAYSIKGIINDL